MWRVPSSNTSNPASTVRDQERLRLAVAYFTFGSYALPMGRWVVIGEIAPVLGAVPAVLIAPFSGGLEGDTLVALFLLLA